jgi:hypothetical protein
MGSTAHGPTFSARWPVMLDPDAAINPRASPKKTTGSRSARLQPKPKSPHTLCQLTPPSRLSMTACCSLCENVPP